MEIVDVLSRWLHVGTAIILAGGVAFKFFVLRHAVASLPEETREELTTSILKIWKRFVHGGIALLLISGLYNFMRAIPAHRGDGTYHQLMGIKILIALAVFAIASLLVGRTKLAQRLRGNLTRWQKLLLVLIAVIVGISGYLKIRGVPSPPADAVEEAASLPHADSLAINLASSSRSALNSDRSSSSPTFASLSRPMAR